MDFIDACKVVLRRWYVVVPLLALTFAGTYFAYSSASAQYTAKSSQVLLVPAAQPIQGKTNSNGDSLTTCDVNPWCAQNDLPSLGNVISLKMTDPSVSKQLEKDNPGSSYTVDLSADNRSPLILIGVTAPTAREALSTLNSVVSALQDQLRELQRSQFADDAVLSAQVPDPQLIQLQTVTKSIKADTQTGNMLRAGLAAFALGIALTLGGAFLFESLAKSRRDNSAKLLDRIAYPETATASAKADAATPTAPAAPATESARDSADEPVTTKGSRIPKPLSAAQRRSGGVGS